MAEGVKISTNEAIRAAMALHDRTIDCIMLRGKPYFPCTNGKGCRTFSIGDYQFMTQNPDEKDSEHAKLAKAGHKLTWIIRFRSWGLVQDGAVVKKTNLIDPALNDWQDDGETILYESSGQIKRVKKEESLNLSGHKYNGLEPSPSIQPSNAWPIKAESIQPVKRANSNGMEVDVKPEEDTKSKSDETVPYDMSNPLASLEGVKHLDGAILDCVIPWEQLVLGVKLGSGAYGEVKKGVWRDTPVAVKILHSADPASTFFQEASLLCRLRHPNIVPCLGVCVEEPHLAIVMELMPGSLAQLIKQNGSMDIFLLLPIAIGIARGIAFLHQSTPKIIHRDLKPDNILMGEGHVPKIGDFGVSKESLATATHTKIGTPSYAAPELLNGEHYGTAVDIYSMGIILYSMVTGGPPFAKEKRGGAGLSPMQIMMKVAIHRERPIIPASTNTVLAEIIHDCWNHLPKSRPTASDLLQRLISLQVHSLGSFADLDSPSSHVDMANAPTVNINDMENAPTVLMGGTSGLPNHLEPTVPFTEMSAVYPPSKQSAAARRSQSSSKNLTNTSKSTSSTSNGLDKVVPATLSRGNSTDSESSSGRSSRAASRNARATITGALQMYKETPREMYINDRDGEGTVLKSTRGRKRKSPDSTLQKVSSSATDDTTPLLTCTTESEDSNASFKPSEAQRKAVYELEMAEGSRRWNLFLKKN